MINEEIQAIADRLASTISPKRMYLFGSFADGSYTDESDYDLYLVVSDDAGNPIDIAQQAYASLRGVRKRPVDIVVNHESVFTRRAALNTLERTVATKGILLYEH